MTLQTPYLRHRPYTYLFSPLKTSLAPTVNQNLTLLNIRHVADLHLSACDAQYVDTRNKRNTLTTPNIMKA
jgi:hypothetical protein